MSHILNGEKPLVNIKALVSKKRSKREYQLDLQKYQQAKVQGEQWESNPWPPAPKAGIIPLDHAPTMLCLTNYIQI